MGLRFEGLLEKRRLQGFIVTFLSLFLCGQCCHFVLELSFPLTGDFLLVLHSKPFPGLFISPSLWGGTSQDFCVI